MHMVLLRDVDKYANNFMSYACTSWEYLKYSLVNPSKPRLVIAWLFHRRKIFFSETQDILFRTKRYSLPNHKIFSSEPQDSRQKIEVLILITLYHLHVSLGIPSCFSFQNFLTKFCKNFTHTLFLILFARSMKCCKNLNYCSECVPSSRGRRQTDKWEVTLKVLILTFNDNFNFDLHIWFKNLIVWKCSYIIF